MKLWALARIAFAVLLGVTSVGCSTTSMALPTSQKLQTEGPKPANEDACGKDKATALNCARYLRDAFAKLETGVGRGEATYGYLSVALAALTAIYMKSDTDRSQAIEDLAIGVATLAGFRAVYNPAQRLRVATDGRRAVECMMQAVDSITALKAETDASKQAAQQAQPNEAKVRDAQDKQRDAEQSLVAAQKSGAAALSTAQKEVDSARANMVSTLQSDGSKMTPVQRLNTAIEREFNIAGLTGAGAAPAAPVTTANLQQVTRGVLLKRQVGDLVQSSTATAGEATAAAEDTVVAKRLSFGLQQVLNNARLALASSSIPADNLIVTQRDAVQTMMGSLAKKVEDEQKEAEQTIGAAAATSSDEDTNAAAGAAAAETRSAARVQLQSVYERCAGEPAS